MQRKTDTAKQAFRTFMPKLNRLLSGNGWQRKAEYLPIVVTALEGSMNNYDKNKTLHFHVCIGNVDEDRLTVDFFEKLVGHWTATGVGTDDIKMHTLYLSSSGFGEYSSKELWQGNADCIDFDLSQIPAHLTGN